uniref:F-box domain-containing protein n=1 Tax=Steinernema glaseri TaxID=37863 RepID=A0A1I7YXD2_9BILA
MHDLIRELPVELTHTARRLVSLSEAVRTLSVRASTAPTTVWMRDPLIDRIRVYVSSRDEILALSLLGMLRSALDN